MLKIAVIRKKCFYTNIRQICKNKYGPFYSERLET